MSNSRIDSFLAIARKDTSISFCSEAKIIERLQSLNKSIILSADSLENIRAAYMDISKAIEAQKTAFFIHYHIDSNGTIAQTTLSRATITEGDVLNIVEEILGDYGGYIFIVDRGFQCLIVNGKISKEIENCLMRTSSMKARLTDLKPVSELPLVFDLFFTECQHGKYYRECFKEEGKISSKIKEQELRNLLMKYLDRSIRGKVQSEFCTDYNNDEESVDIYLNDATESAIIEVKFAFSKAHYDGKTYYGLSDRAKKGYKQLEKYADHLAKDDRRIEYGYLYIFHMTDDSDENVHAHVNSIYASIKDKLSAHFESLYTETVYNNLQLWAAPSLCSTYY